MRSGVELIVSAPVVTIVLAPRPARSPPRSTGVVRGASSTALVGWLALLGCAPTVVERPPGQAYYSTSFPLGDVSRDFERILPSVVRIQVSTTYDVYEFAASDAPTDSELLGGGDALLARAIEAGPATSGRASTAIVLAYGRGRGTLVTTDHGISFPDTTLDYFGAEVPQRVGSPLVERISIKRRQVNTVVGETFVESFRVLARSTRRDLALIGIELPRLTDSIPRLRVEVGTPRRLSWGSLVYIVGYPGGYRMVTHAIVSKIEGSDDAFMTDGLVNEGTSGAPIFAVRSGSDGLEWVGIVRAAAQRSEQRLVAPDGADRGRDPRLPYDGPIYLRGVEEIRQGITLSTPVSVIRDFVGEHRSLLAAGRYPVPEL